LAVFDGAMSLCQLGISPSHKNDFKSKLAVFDGTMPICQLAISSNHKNI
jgi:hypothetical protein